jgi:hypothetical protein
MQIHWHEREDDSPRYFLGLDLGQSADFTALAIVERHGTRKEGALLCRHLQRWPLGTAYPQIVADVCALLKGGVFAPRRPTLAVDQTGVGAAVVDMLREAKPRASLAPVLITAGDQVNYEQGVYRVPKRELVSITQVALQTERLKVAEALAEASVLQREMQNFQVKITLAANDTYGAWREGAHDDLVLAVALALCAATHPRLNQEWSYGTYIV